MNYPEFSANEITPGCLIQFFDDPKISTLEFVISIFKRPLSKIYTVTVFHDGKVENYTLVSNQPYIGEIFK